MTATATLFPNFSPRNMLLTLQVTSYFFSLFNFLYISCHHTLLSKELQNVSQLLHSHCQTQITLCFEDRTGSLTDSVSPVLALPFGNQSSKMHIFYAATHLGTMLQCFFGIFNSVPKNILNPTIVNHYLMYSPCCRQLPSIGFHFLSDHKVVAVCTNLQVSIFCTLEISHTGPHYNCSKQEK